MSVSKRELLAPMELHGIDRMLRLRIVKHREIATELSRVISAVHAGVEDRGAEGGVIVKEGSRGDGGAADLGDVRAICVEGFCEVTGFRVDQDR